MTTKPQDSKPETEPDGMSEAALDGIEWEEVSEEDVDEIKQSFDTLGEVFTAVYLGYRQTQTDSGTLTQYRFRKDGLTYFINGTWSLMQGMAKVPVNSPCRIQWVSERDTGQPSPMRVFRVDIPKRNVRRGKGAQYVPPIPKSGGGSVNPQQGPVPF